MSFSPLISQLIEALRCLPGVGPKSAQRMAIHLLDREPEKAAQLVKVMALSLEKVRRCLLCRTLSESDNCDICTGNSRDRSQLCVVESPIDILAIEQMGGFSGQYFVLTGLLSPLDGIGPEALKLHEFVARLKDPSIQEVILATSPTVEGEATAQYLTGLIREQGKNLTRITYGVPFGGELEYVDSNTLSHAFRSRQTV